MAAAAAFIAWLAITGGHGSSPRASVAAGSAASSRSTAPIPGSPVVFDESALKARVHTLRQPVFWAGPEQKRRYEFRRANGNVFVRYLPAGVRPGAAADQFLMIATYPYPDANAAAMKAIKDSPSLRYREVPNGGLAVVDPDAPTSVFLTFPGLDYQIEIFSPSPTRARDVAVSGRVKAIG